MKDVLRAVAIVFVVCAAAAGSLSFVYSSTKDRIADQARIEREEAFRNVFPRATEFRETVPEKEWAVDPGSGNPGRVLAVTTPGYGGPISLVIGMDGGRRVTGIKVMSHTETPGLGAKITGEKFQAQFAGRDVAELRLSKDDPQKGRIDAISAATITSRAVTDAVRSAVEAGGNQ